MPKADHPPAFPFYVDDFIADSAVDAMSNQEVGIYMRLLCKAWKEDPVGTLPIDDHLLARWAKETPATWRKCKAGVFRAFRVVDGRLHQKRMMEVWEKTIENRKAKSEAGKKGMASRWQNDNRAITDAITKNNLPFPIPIPISSSIPNSNNTGQTGAMDLVLDEEQIDRSRHLAKRIQAATKIDCRQPDNHALVAKIAILWALHEFTDADMESILEAFGKGEIKSRVRYLCGAVGKRCNGRSLNEMLDSMQVPEALKPPTGAKS